MKKGLLIFDFDGVLADTFDTFYPLIRDSMSSIGFKLGPNQYKELFIGNVHSGYRDFIKNDKKLAAFLKTRKTNYDRYYYDTKTKAKLFYETGKFIKKAAKKHRLTIASSGYTENVKTLLGNYVSYFGLILANSDPKENMIKKILNKFKASARKTIFVTDTVGDIKAAKKMKLKTIAVSWGFQNAKFLKKYSPNKVVKSFKELEKALLDLSE